MILNLQPTTSPHYTVTLRRWPSLALKVPSRAPRDWFRRARKALAQQALSLEARVAELGAPKDWVTRAGFALQTLVVVGSVLGFGFRCVQAFDLIGTGQAVQQRSLDQITGQVSDLKAEVTDMKSWRFQRDFDDRAWRDGVTNTLQNYSTRLDKLDEAEKAMLAPSWKHRPG